MSIPVNPVVVGEATKKSNFDTLYNGTVLVNTGGVAGGAQSIPGAKTFDDKTTFSSGFIASGTCTYYAPVAGEESAGTLHLVPEVDRPAWVLSAAGSITYTDVDFGAYVPEGVKGLLLKYILLFQGNNLQDLTYAFLRENGSTETNGDRLSRISYYRTNLPSGVLGGIGGDITCLCDKDGVIEYRTAVASDTLYLNIIGYWI